MINSDCWPDDARHCLRIGALSDKAVVQDAQATFDVLVVQANLAISASRALASWAQLHKPFWIDPIAYAFAASPQYLMSEQKVTRGQPETRLDYKRTFRALAEAYGEPFATALREVRSLRPEDVRPLASEVATAVCDWQRTVLRPEEDAKFGITEHLEPVLLTVPFFPLLYRPGSQPEWLDTNLALIRGAAEHFNPYRLCGGVLMDGDVFNQQAEQILNAYADLPIEHLWLWISDNEETTMSEHRAQSLAALVADLAKRGKRVHQAFGGTFSSLLLSQGLASVSHGVGYWEQKGWEPLAGGGLPTLRFFYPPLGQRLPVLDVDAILDTTIDDASDFHERVCDCRMCIDVLADDLSNFSRYGAVEVRTRRDRWGNRIEYDVPRPEALRASRFHYLYAKQIETARTSTEGFSPRDWLQASEAAHRRQQQVSLRHLERWRNALG